LFWLWQIPIIFCTANSCKKQRINYSPIQKSVVAIDRWIQNLNDFNNRFFI
jgi:hypothetical protein